MWKLPLLFLLFSFIFPIYISRLHFYFRCFASSLSGCSGLHGEFYEICLFSIFSASPTSVLNSIPVLSIHFPICSKFPIVYTSYYRFGSFTETHLCLCVFFSDVSLISIVTSSILFFHTKFSFIVITSFSSLYQAC